MADDNAYSTVYISNLDEDSVVYMDIQPSPFPVIPFPTGEQSFKRCLPGLDDDGNITAGNMIAFDGGAVLGGNTISWQCSRCVEATREALLEMYYTLENVLFSLDDGDTVYLAQWDRGNPPKIYKNPGRKTYNLEISLRVLALQE